MENDSSDRFQSDTFQDEGSIAGGEEEVQPLPSLHGSSPLPDIRDANLADSSSEKTEKQTETGIVEEIDEKVDMYQNVLREEEAINTDAWNLCLEHVDATYQSSTSFTSSILDSERSNLNHRESSAPQRLHQQLQRQSLLSDEAIKNEQLLQPAGCEHIANSMIEEKEEKLNGVPLRPAPSGGTTTWQPPRGKQGELLDLEQPTAVPLGGRTVSSSASTKPPPPPYLNRHSNHHRPSQPGAVAMVGHQLQANLPVEGLDDRTVQVGIEERQEDQQENGGDKEAASPLVDAVLVSDDTVEAPTSPQQSVAATAAVPIDGNDVSRWGLRDRRVVCVICLLVSIIACLAAGLSFVFLQNDQEDDSIVTSSPTSTPTMKPVPTASPTSRMAFLQRLLSKYVSDVLSWENINSTQYHALDWLANEDTWRPLDMDSADPERAIVERYSMLIIYFSLGGPSWREDEPFVDLSRPVCSWQEEYCHSIGNCAIHGVLCEEQFVTGLILGDIDIVGTIPTEIGLLSSLSTFLVENATLYGTLPEELFLLPELESVSIVDSGLTGTLPKTILQAPTLSWLNLRGNAIDGNMENAANLGLLELELAENQFTGALPSSLSNELYYLDVSDNAGLTGTVPNTYSKLSITNLFLEGTSLTNVESVFCGTGLLDYEEFYADCGGSRPKVLCRCCTHCCDTIDCFPK